MRFLTKFDNGVNRLDGDRCSSTRVTQQFKPLRVILYHISLKTWAWTRRSSVKVRAKS